jgi:hypothetical protein
MSSLTLPSRSSATSRSLRRRGGAGLKILVVLSALCLVLGVVGFFVAKSGLTNDIIPTAQRLVKDVQGGEGARKVISPGEASIDLTGAGGMLFVVAEKTKIDDKEYTYAPGGKLDLTMKAADGTTVKVEAVQGVQPFDVDGNKLHLVAVSEIPGPGSYTITASGQETVVYFAGVTGADWTSIQSGLVKLVGGGLGACCGFPLFLLFGIIAGVILIFGKKPAPMP